MRTAQLPQKHRRGVDPLCSPSLPGCLQRGSSTKAQWPSAPPSPQSDSYSISPAAHVCSGLSTAVQDSTAVIHTPAAWTRSIIQPQDLMSTVLLGTGVSDMGWPWCLQCQLESGACLSGTTAFDVLMQLQCFSGAVTWPSALAHAGWHRSQCIGTCCLSLSVWSEDQRSWHRSLRAKTCHQCRLLMYLQCAWGPCASAEHTSHCPGPGLGCLQMCNGTSPAVWPKWFL